MSVGSIWKQDISEDHVQKFQWPRGARVIHHEIQNGKPRLWFQFPAEDREERELRVFRLYPTGVPMEEIETKRHVATFMLYGGEIVAHLYEDLG